MDGKRTNFDMRRRNLDDDFSPDSAGTSQIDSAKDCPANDNTRDRYDRSFLAERGLLSSPHTN
jgi:hypothetical protein